MSDFIAKEHIYAGDPGRGVIAYAKGARVTADAVKANGWEDQVVGTNTKEGREIVAGLTGEPVDQGTSSASQSASRSSTTSSGQKG